ncbi:MAG: hypothetical protein ABL971_10430 [Vicinamibacterales bacterium]
MQFRDPLPANLFELRCLSLFCLPDVDDDRPKEANVAGLRPQVLQMGQEGRLNVLALSPNPRAPLAVVVAVAAVSACRPATRYSVATAGALEEPPKGEVRPILDVSNRRGLAGHARLHSPEERLGDQRLEVADAADSPLPDFESAHIDRVSQQRPERLQAQGTALRSCHACRIELAQHLGNVVAVRDLPEREPNEIGALGIW